MLRSLVGVSRTLLIAGLVYAGAGSGWAYYHEAAVSADFTDRAVTEKELYEVLIPQPATLTRGINPVRKPRKADLSVNFELNSAKLTEQGKQVLEPVGAVLGSEEGRKRNFQIEGHTDSSGSEAYNMRLSVRRAEAVKAYLVSEYRINADQLLVVGMGESQPMKGRKPDDPRNRRVTVVTTVE